MQAKGGGWSFRSILFRAASPALWLALSYCSLYGLPHHAPALCGHDLRFGWACVQVWGAQHGWEPVAKQWLAGHFDCDVMICSVKELKVISVIMLKQQKGYRSHQKSIKTLAKKTSRKTWLLQFLQTRNIVVYREHFIGEIWTHQILEL